MTAPSASFSAIISASAPTCGLTYWHLDADTGVTGTAGLGQTIVDPFGNLGLGGSSYRRLASVQMNVLDFECVRRLEYNWAGVGLRLFGGFAIMPT